MKKTSYFILILGLLFIQKSFAQYPVSFPDGIVIGTATTTIPASSPYKLAVSGGIITEKVRVATNGTPFWADFVFEPTYQLRTLGELEKFIQTNKHLPEIPSTSDVTKNGIDLAEMQALLLQKVEELSLYVIEQNKKIKTLEKKVKHLSRR
jgi:hypothetical protein